MKNIFFSNKEVLTRRLKNTLIYVTLLLLSFIFMIPFAWLLSSSFKENARIFIQPPQWIPDPFRYQNYSEVMHAIPVLTYLGNTLKIALTCLVANVFMSALTAFAFSRLRARGSGILFGILLATMMLPGEVTMIPKYVMFSDIGWIDTHLPMIVPVFFGGSAYHIFLMRQFFSGIPKSMDDAARIDGVSNFGLFWRIILPSAKPVLITVAIFTFVGRWNEFFDPLLYINSTKLYTLPLGLNFFKNVYNNQWNLIMAYNVLTIVPIIMIFFFAQRYFIQGIVISGDKG